jgi:putative ABC transport system permease protein
MAAESSSFDPRLEILRRATAAGVVLPRSTVDELREHLEDVMAAARAEGASEDETQRAALAALDEAPLAPLRRHAARNPERLHARLADAQARGAGGRTLNVLSAVRLATRQFRQHPSFALITVLVLGLGTRAATTVFTVVDSVILRPLPYAAPDRLVTLWDTNIERGLAHEPISPVNFMDYRALPVFDDAAAWWVPSVNLVDPGQDPVRVNTIEVSANIFSVLGVTPQFGDGFPGDRFTFPNERIVAISDRLWRNRYKADPSIVGRPLVLNGQPWTVVGVMRARFNYPGDVDVWQRLQWDPHQHSRAAHFMNAVLRLKDGTTLSEAQSATETLAARLQNDFSATNKAWSARLVPLLDETLGYYRPALMVLFGAVACSSSSAA